MTLAQMAEVMTPHAVDPGPHTADPAAHTGTPQTMRILIAEDDLVTARLLRALLDSWGFEVVTVTEEDISRALLMLLVIHFVKRDGLRHPALESFHAEPQSEPAD